MFVGSRSAILENIPRLASASEDVAITAPSKLGFKDRGTALSTACSIGHNAPIQAYQPEFDWMYNINAFQRLKHLITLKDNWDGYRAPRFTKQHIRRALDLFAVIQAYFIDKDLNFSDFSPFIAPCSDGAILFEWGGKRFPERELEIFVPANLSESFEYLKSTQDSDEEGDFATPDLVIFLLEWLVGKVIE